MTKKERKQKLTELIEMKTPTWLTPEVYQDYKAKFGFYKTTEFTPSAFQTAVEDLPGIISGSVTAQNPQWKYIDANVTAEFFYRMWEDKRLISPPSTGQDPKTWSKSNYETACEHFGNMWGDVNGSYWLREGTLNLVYYQERQDYVLEATDIEHRLWGIIGGAKGLLELKSDKSLWFTSPNIRRSKEDELINLQAMSDLDIEQSKKEQLAGMSIQVNGLTIDDIAVEASKYSDIEIKKDEVLKFYFKKTKIFKIRLLPMFTDKECHNFYKTLNKASNKTLPQLLHASTYDSIFWIKENSSIKLENFGGGHFNLHPFYKQLFPNSLKINLETFMISNLLFQYVTKKKGKHFVESTDAKIKSYIEDTHGYQKDWESDEIEDIKDSVIEKLDILYKFYSEIENPKFSRQVIQQVLRTIEWLEEEGNKVIFDWNLFANSLYDFIEQKRVHPKTNADGTKNKLKGTKTPFGVDLGASNIRNYESAFNHIKDEFLFKYLYKGSKDDSKQIGITNYSDRIPRLFSNEVIDDSEKKHKGKDIDNTPISGRRVGGHIISDFELIRLSDEERVQAFIDEDLGDEFDFDLNCRAMSSYHNLRMSILRLSEYLSVMNDSDEVVKQKIREKKESLKNKPILV